MSINVEIDSSITWLKRGGQIISIIFISIQFTLREFTVRPNERKNE